MGPAVHGAPGYLVADPRIWEELVWRTEIALEAAAGAGIPAVGALIGPNRWEAGYAAGATG